MTSTMEMISVRSTSLTEARMVVVRSRTMVMSMPWGMEAFNDGNWAAMRSTVWIMLAPGSRKMMMTIAGLPFR